MPDVVVLQRVIPHYRLPLWRGLHERHGWHVACAANPPGDTHLHLVGAGEAFVHHYPFRSFEVMGRTIVVPPLGRIIRELQPRVVVAEFSLVMTSTWELALRRRLLGCPRLAFHTHGFNMERGFRSPIDRLLQWIRIPFYRASDQVMCYSDEGQDFVLQYLAPEKVAAVQNTIDISEIRALRASEPAAEGPRGRPRLLSIGRLTADKDFPRLVRVFRKLLAAFPDAVLVIIGDGPERGRVEQAAGDALNRQIFLPGAVYDERVNAGYFNWADVVVFAGAAGLSVNHALAYGVPVVAYARTEEGPHHHPEIAYIVEDVTGVLVRSYSDEALQATLEALFRDKEWPRERFRNLDHFVDEALPISQVVDNFAAAVARIKKQGRPA